jgi:hypothetical protein
MHSAFYLSRDPQAAKMAASKVAPIVSAFRPREA